jgi:HlyD family secretion protein
MIEITRRRIIIAAIAVLVAVAIIFAFLPDAVPVQTATVERASLRVMVEEEGRTEVTDRYAITAPVAAFVQRIDLEVGDVVTAGAAIARLEPPRKPLLDPRSRTEAAAHVRAAQATAEATASERARLERLAAAGAATPQALEQATGEARRAAADLEAARAALRATESGRSVAARDVVRAPAAGRVLSVRRRSEGQVNPGDTLVVIGNTGQLEVHSDVLSQDAVRIRPGTVVLVEDWGGEPLEAVVSRVAPQGFTAVSSLGVEEQRVPVIATITSPAELWSGALGSGYRVLARFVVWHGENVLQVPSSALFRIGTDWAVFVVEGGRARRRIVTTGQHAGLVTEVIDGLTAGDVVIVHPRGAVHDGVRVDPQPEG